MKENTLPNHTWFFCLLLFTSLAFYGSYQALMTEFKTIGHTQSQAIFALSWVFIIYSFRSQLITFNKALSTLQKIATPWLILLLVASSAATLKNLLGFVTEYPISVPYLANIENASKYILFVRSVALLIIQIVIPTFIATVTARTLQSKFTKNKLSTDLLNENYS